MAGSILTPQALWGNFKVEPKPEADLITERKVGDLIVSRIYIDGRNTVGGKVKIFGTMARLNQTPSAPMPAVLIVKDFESDSGDEVSMELAKRGYLALTIDLAGKKQVKPVDFEKRADDEKFTLYPDDIEYANYYLAKDNLMKIKKGVKDTCWYEWGAVVRYAYEFLKNQPMINRIGGVGIKEGATLLWQLAGTDNKFSALVAVMNAGWRAYKNQLKFSDAVIDTQMSEDEMKYIAGVDPQSYAPSVKCPTLLLVATNSYVYDADRAQDTLSRIVDRTYTALCYSPNEIGCVDNFCYRDMILFLDEVLFNGDKKCENLPSAPEAKCVIKKGKLEIEVKADETELAELCVFVSEGTENPALRCWKKVSGNDKNDKGHRVFYYSPYSNSEIVTFFVKSRYDSGFTVCSPVAAKRFKAEDVEIKHKERIVFSGREKDAVSTFSEIQPSNQSFIMHTEKAVGVKEKNGPMGIAGAYAKNGLITFKINAEKDKPMDSSMLMLDVYAQTDDELVVKLVCDILGARTEYVCREAVKGGKVWHNVKIDMNKFKAADGKIIKSFANVNAIEFSLTGTYIINNVLWL